MISHEKKQEIITAFGAHLGRDSPEEISSFALSDLQDAESMLGNWDLNASYRVALRNRISEMEDRAKQEHEDKLPKFIAAIGKILVTGAIITLVVSFLR